MDLYIATRCDSPDILNLARVRTLGLGVINCSGDIAFKSVWMLFFITVGIVNELYIQFKKNIEFCKSEWFRVGFDKALEVARSCEAPQARRVQPYDLEAKAQKHLNRGRTLKSTRYPHLKPKNEG